MDQRYIDLYDEFTHTGLPRRVFMERRCWRECGNDPCHSFAKIATPANFEEAIDSVVEPVVSVASTTEARAASSKTTIGVLPPSSRFIRFNVGAPCAAMIRPTGLLPV